jgi:hypothetical protein
VLGALLPLVDIWPIMTMTMQMSPASVSSIGARIHANRPALPIFAVVLCLGSKVGAECVFRNVRLGSSLSPQVGRMVVQAIVNPVQSSPNRLKYKNHK